MFWRPYLFVPRRSVTNTFWRYEITPSKKKNLAGLYEIRATFSYRLFCGNFFYMRLTCRTIHGSKHQDSRDTLCEVYALEPGNSLHRHHHTSLLWLLPTTSFLEMRNRCMPILERARTCLSHVQHEWTKEVCRPAKQKPRLPLHNHWILRNGLGQFIWNTYKLSKVSFFC